MGQSKASFYRPTGKNSARCFLCHRNCVIPDGKTGLCGVRKNSGGKLYSLVYGRALTTELDPVEKKPLYHFKPGSKCLGVSTFGCNFFCLHCQNANISQQRNESVISKVPFTAPKRIVELALSAGAQGIAYTYNEPTVFAEYALDTMKLARQKGLYNAWVSNGYMSNECVAAVSPLLDAINVDLKGNEAFYRDVCGDAKISFVKDNIRAFHAKGVHVEVTNLVVPGFNDSEKDFRRVSEFMLSIDEKMPLHFTRFSPQHKLMDLPPTPLEKLRQAKEIALGTGLKFVYIGNVLGDESSICPECRALLVKRVGFSSEKMALGAGGECKKCGARTGFVV